MKPEVLAMMSLLNASRESVIGALVQVWLWADSVTREGKCDYPPSIIDNSVSGFNEGDITFSEAMEKVGWLVKTDDGGFILPRIDRYTGDGRTSRDRRLTQQEKARSQKRGKNGKFVSDADRPTLTGIQPTHGPSTSSPTGGASGKDGPSQPIPTQPIPSQHIHSDDEIGDGDFTGQTLPSGRFHLISTQLCTDIARLIDAIPPNRRRATAKIKRAIAAALDRGVEASTLDEALRGYYASDEGSGEYATWPANFIDQERYEEDPSAWTRGDSSETRDLREML